MQTKLSLFQIHIYGVDWDYHHCLGLINHTSFLLNYLSDIVDGAQSYADWVNGDLYECTEEQFSICTLPGMSETVFASFITDLNTVEALQTCLAMQSYNNHTAAEFQILSTDGWL